LEEAHRFLAPETLVRNNQLFNQTSAPMEKAPSKEESQD
jgi:hypothetical protein